MSLHRCLTRCRILVLVFAVAGLAAQCRASEWYRPELLFVRAFDGKDAWSPVGPDPGDHYRWVNVSLCAEKRVSSFFSVVSGIGPGYLKSANHGSSPSLEWRLAGKVRLWRLYLEAGGGLAYLFDRDEIPDLADSALYGLISAAVGVQVVCLARSRHPLCLCAGYRVEHISSPFHQKGRANDGDTGWNVGALTASVVWHF